MTLLKKYAKYGSAVVASFAVAVALLTGSSPRVAHAADNATHAAPLFTAPIQAAGLVEIWTVTSVYSDADTDEPLNTAGSDTITIEFPTSFTIPTSPTTTLTDGTNALTHTVVVTGTVLVFTITGDGASGGITNTETITITVAGVTNPAAGTFTANATPGASQGFAMTTSESAEVVSAASVRTWNGSSVKSPTTSVQADGSSTVQVTFTTSNTVALTNTGSTAGAQPITVTTDVGTIAITPTVGTAPFGTPTAITAGAQTATSTFAATTAASATFVVTIKAPSAAGTSTVILRATPNNGGQSVIISSTQITWTAATTAGAVAAGSVAPAGSTVINSTGAGSTQVLTYTFVDASGNAPIPGATVVCSASLGTLTAPTNGTGTGTQQTTGAIPVGGVFAVTLNGSGLGGTSTVTCVVGTVSVPKTVTISGLGASMTLTTTRGNATTGLTAKGSIRGTDSSTTDQDEMIVVAAVKDANGNVVGSGNVQFTLSTPAGSTMVLQAATESLTLTTTACSVSGTGTTICVDAIEAGAGGSALTPAAVAFIDVDSASAFPEPSGTYTVTARYTNSDATVITATATFTVALPVATITFGEIPVIPVGGTASLPFTVADSAGGVPVAGSVVTITVSNTNLLVQDAVGATGQAGGARTSATGTGSITLIGVAAGTSTVVANIGTVTKVATVTVGVVTPPVTPPPTGTGFSGGTIAPAGVSIVSFTGTTAQLTAAGTTAKVVSVTATVGGKMITFVIGAPDFVNAEFNAAFPTGLSATLVIVKTGT